MNALASSALELLAQATVRGAVLALLTALVLRAARVRNARLLHLAWSSVMLATLALPLLHAALPPIALLPSAVPEALRSRLADLAAGTPIAATKVTDAAAAREVHAAVDSREPTRPAAAPWEPMQLDAKRAGSRNDDATREATVTTHPVGVASHAEAEADGDVRRVSASAAPETVRGLRAAATGLAPQSESRRHARLDARGFTTRGFSTSDGRGSLASAWPTLLLIVHLAGALVLLARLAAGQLAARRLVARSRPLTMAARATLWASAGAARAERLPFAMDDARLEVRESSRVATPLTIGVWRPALLLPDSWSTWDRDTCAAVLRHELAHASRRDGAVQLLALLTRALFWFNPLTWWLHRRIVSLAEDVCDDAALSEGTDRADYARMLLAFLARAQGGRVLPTAAPMGAGGRWERRIDRIMDRTRPLSTSSRRLAPTATPTLAVRIRPAFALVAALAIVCIAAATGTRAADPVGARSAVAGAATAEEAATDDRRTAGASRTPSPIASPSLAARWRDAFNARADASLAGDRWIAFTIASQATGVASNAGFGAARHHERERSSVRDGGQQSSSPSRSASTSISTSTSASTPTSPPTSTFESMSASTQTYADAWRDSRIPSPLSPPSPPARRVAVLFHVPAGATSPRAIDGMKLRSLSAPMDIAPAGITWIGDAAADESLPLLGEIYAALRSVPLRKEVAGAVAVHDEPVRVLRAIAPYLDTSEPARVRREAVLWLGQWHGGAEDVRELIARTAREDPAPAVRRKARDLLAGRISECAHPNGDAPPPSAPHQLAN